MKRQSLIGQMLDHVMGIECVNRTVSKRQLAADVSPNVDLRSNEVGVDVDATGNIIFLAGATAEVLKIISK